VQADKVKLELQLREMNGKNAVLVERNLEIEEQLRAAISEVRLA
jgi:hypothetical protein